MVALATAIGATTVLLSAVEAVALRPLPIPQADRVVSVRLRPASGSASTAPTRTANWDLFTAWRESALSFDALMAYAPSWATLSGRGPARHIQTVAVTAGAMSFLGSRPTEGRSFVPAEDDPGQSPTVIVSAAFRNRTLGAEARVLDENLVLDGRSFTIVGVMPAGFRVPNSVPEAEKDEAEVWIPMGVYRDPGFWSDEPPSVEVLGRLRKGVDPLGAEAQLDQVIERLEAVDGTSPAGTQRAEITALRRVVAGQLERPLLLLLGIAIVLLLIALSNTAAMLLSRTALRRREVAVRVALGASPSDVIRLCILDAFVLVGIASAIGVGLAAWVLPAIVRLAYAQLPDVGPVELNLPVYVLIAGMSVVAALSLGAWTGWRAQRTRIVDTLMEEQPSSTTSGRHGGAASALLVSQVALATVLLTATGLLSRSFLGLVGSPRGFDVRQTVIAAAFLPLDRYSTPLQQVAYLRTAAQRLRDVPGVETAAGATGAPIIRGTSSIVGTGASPDTTGGTHMAVWGVSEEYFAALGLRLLSGQTVSAARADGVVLDRAAASILFGSADPVGQRVAWGWSGDTRSGTVVGVVGDFQEFALGSGGSTRTRSAEPHLYVPLQLAPAPIVRFVVRSRGDPAALLPSLRETLGAVDPNLPLDLLETVSALDSLSLLRERLLALLALIFGASALATAALGVYSVVAIGAVRRTREMGIRIALGAQPREIVASLIGRGLSIALVGVALGLLGALALTRLLQSVLFGVSASDPSTFALVAGVIITSVAAAGYLPARRVLRLDPVRSLRDQ
jgi:putative ABC transport system permease protein